MLAEALKIEEPVARTLVKGGFATVDSFLDVEPQDIADASGIDLEKAKSIQDAARKEHEKNMAST